MHPDLILSQLRRIATKATRADRPRPVCRDLRCAADRELADLMVIRFTELDIALTFGDDFPLGWIFSPFPAQRAAS